MVDPISLPRLAICFVPMIVLLIWLAKDRRPVRPTLLGLARMTLQLLAVGYVLVYLFDPALPWLTPVALGVMGVAAATIAIRTSANFNIRRWLLAGGCLLVATVSTLGIVLVFVFDLWPWQKPQTVIPLVGMTLSSAMNALSLAIERYDAAIDRTDGVTVGESDRQQAAIAALDTALIPMTNSLMAVGVVSLPGMMTGQVLAGVPPFVAARYQIMIMCLLFASAGIATKLFLTFEQRHKN